MPKKTDARQNMITAARTLIESQGASATGILDVVAAADAPRGSIYHHFPGGKEELVLAAIEEAASLAETAIHSAGRKGGTPADVVQRIATVFRYAPERSGWTKGCPVAATTLEGAIHGPKVRDAVAAAFTRWSAAVAKALQASGLDSVTASRLGVSVISSLEGALVLARGMRSAAPYDATVELLLAGMPSPPSTV